MASLSACLPLQRRLERPIAHRLDRGRLRRLHVMGKASVHKQELLLATAQNLSLLLRAKYGVGTPCRMTYRAWQAASGLLEMHYNILLSTLWAKRSAPWVPLLQAQFA